MIEVKNADWPVSCESRRYVSPETLYRVIDVKKHSPVICEVVIFVPVIVDSAIIFVPVIVVKEPEKKFASPPVIDGVKSICEK